MRNAFRSRRVMVMARATTIAFAGFRQSRALMLAALAGVFMLLTASQVAAQVNALEVAPADLVAGQGFGDSVCASGGLFAVGSRLDDTKGNNAGAVHVFSSASGL